MVHSIRIRVEPGRFVPLYFPGSTERSHALRPEHGVVTGIRLDNDWLVVAIPGHEIGGLCLSGEGASWETVWGNENIQVEVLTPSGWKQIDDWSEVSSADNTN